MRLQWSLAALAVPLLAASIGDAQPLPAEPIRVSYRALLDAHEATFPGGALTQEATLLRIEALVRLGRRPEAAALGRAFAEAHPGSPLLAKVHEIVNP